MPDESQREENAESREKWRKQKLLDQEIRRQMEQRTRRHMKWLAENRLLQLCGKHCLELYLLHTFFTAGFRSLLPLLGVRTPWFSVWLNFTLSTALCLLLAYLAGRFRWTDVIFRPSRIWERMRG